MQSLFENVNFEPAAGEPSLDWSGIDIEEPRPAPRWRWAGVAAASLAVAETLSQMCFTQWV